MKAARQLGASVAITSSLGNGFPDAVIGFKGVNHLVEIKDGDKPPSQRKLTDDEQKWHDGWKGKVCVVENIDDIIDLLNSH